MHGTAETQAFSLAVSSSLCGGVLVSTGMLEALVAGRGAAGLVKSGNKVIANNDYEYAYAA